MTVYPLGTLDVSLSDDGKTLTIDGVLPPEAARQAKGLAEAYEITLEQSVQVILRLGIRAQTMADGQHRGDAREPNFKLLIEEIVNEVREEEKP